MAIYEFLNQFQEHSFHMPGHKGKIPVPIVDVTELSGTDNLMRPEGIIQKAQENLAQKIGKRQVFFLTNGATCGILASVLAATREGETVLVDRNCHVSVLNGLILTGAIPKFVYPEQNLQFGIPSPLKAESIPYRGEKTLILTSPTYYGEVADLKEIRKKAECATILQDESHGSHFYFCSRLKPYTQNYADLSVLSFHKTMPTMNQGAVLCLNTNRFSPEEVKRCINLIHTTSPSYPILSSIDYSADIGESLYADERVLNEIILLKEYLISQTPFEVLENEDCYKLLINCDRVKESAAEIATYLETNYRIYIEGVFGNNLLFLFSPCNEVSQIRLLFEAFSKKTWQEISPRNLHQIPCFPLEQKLSPKEAFFAPGERVSRKDAVGRVSKENITRFPPCVPLVTVGEVFNEEVIACLDCDTVEVVK